MRAVAVNLAWLVPTVVLSGAPVWVCVLLPLVVVVMGLTLA